MLTIVHGNDVLSSRRYFADLKNKDALVFDAENVNPLELSQSLQGSGLFGNERTIFIENLFSKKASKNVRDILEFLKNSREEVYLWAGAEIPFKTLSLFPKHTLKTFKIQQSIFTFLDAIRPQSPENVKKFHEALKFSDPEIIFHMLVRQFRLLLSMFDESSIDEAKRLADWQESKFRNQAKLFGQEKLKKIHAMIYDIERGQKLGTDPHTLSQAIDFLLVEI